MTSLLLLFALAADPTVPVREVASDNFRVVTDLPDEEAQKLLDELETMIVNVSGYWGKKLPSTIDMYVARDIDAWPEDRLETMSEDGIKSIQVGAGVTLTQRISRGSAWKSRSVVYAVSEHGTAQHEAVHAYCGLAFGRTGPTWYAEGMAEVGQYWRADDPAAVHIHPGVLKYLQETPPKPLKELVSLNQTTGDSWQAYASRWALCHQLGFNPNYSKRFRTLGLYMLSGTGVTFEEAFGPVAREVDFEYRLFMSHLCQGYRADLCHWDWEGTPKPLRARGLTLRVDAKRGWQAQRVQLEPGKTYRVVAEGEWSVDDSTVVSADGVEDGRGRLVACNFADYALPEEFELGADTTFSVETEGQLCLRCRDGWDAIADNAGTLKLTITAE